MDDRALDARRGPGRIWYWAALAGAVAWMLWRKWAAIHWFALGDTDDNLRLAEVRAWLGGQGWYDLRQYKLDPPGGASIHWSRLVDLPIAGLILSLRPFLGALQAEKVACAIAPMLPFAVALGATMRSTRQLVAPWAALLAAAILLSAPNAMAMFMPLRIDHHGWQLAMLALAIGGLADSRPARGGVMVGLASAASLTIGLELIHYLAACGAAVGLWWAADRQQAARLRGYGVALAGGAAIGFLLFASRDNRLPVCDALSPVYLSTLVLAGGALAALSFAPVERARWRLALFALAGAMLLGFFALAWPDCLGRPEHVSPELDRLWLSHVREARPIYTHGWRTALTTSALPVLGVIGAIWAWAHARGGPRAPAWAVLAGLSLCSALLLLWQTRAGPGAQLLAVPGATALGWKLAGLIWRGQARATAALALAAAAALLYAGTILAWIPEPPATARSRAIGLANRRCPTLPALRPIAQLPAQTILTFVDLGPRLIAMTHHRAIAGPYHRNGAAILDIQHAFRATDPGFVRNVMRRHGATLVLICPNLSESTVYNAEARRGFYVQLIRGQVPPWLTPVPLPKGSPYRLWRLVETH